MPLPIEDYALIGDGHTAALVGGDGPIDWLCLPRFDSGACFAALLGSPAHGRWLIAPRDAVRRTQRRYRDGTLILETDFETETGAVRVIDCMPLSNERWDVLRIVQGLHGRVRMHMELVIRFDYGSIVPWVHRTDGTLFATAGPDTLELHMPVQTHGEHMTSKAAFEVGGGERVSFVLNYRPSHAPAQGRIDAEQTLVQTESRWRDWSQRCSYQGRWRRPVLRYMTATGIDSLPPGEGVFLPCSFWLADCMAVTGRHAEAEAEALFERLLALRNDVGLLSEEFDPRTGHVQGNFPQALSHMALVNTARLLSLASEQVKASSQKGERPAAASTTP